MTKKRIAVALAGSAVVVAMAVPFVTMAATPHAKAPMTGMHKMPFGKGFHGPAVFGTVSAINGASITVAGKNGTTYTVDDTNAKVSKGFAGPAGTLADIKVGDTIVVSGTMNGTSVAATAIFDGPMPAKDARKPFDVSTEISHIGFGGTVQSISGSSLTVVDNNGVTYTVDGTKAHVASSTTHKASTLSNVQVGDKVSVSGTYTNSPLAVTGTRLMDATR